MGALGHTARPAVAIVVAAHRRERRDFAQRIEDRRIADIAGVDDVRRAAQEAQRLGAKQAVGVGDEADARQRMKLTVPSDASSMASRIASRALILSPLARASSV